MTIYKGTGRDRPIITLKISQLKEMNKEFGKGFFIDNYEDALQAIYIRLLIELYEADKAIPYEEYHSNVADYFTGEWNGKAQSLYALEPFVKQRYDIADYKGKRKKSNIRIGK